MTRRLTLLLAASGALWAVGFSFGWYAMATGNARALVAACAYLLLVLAALGITLWRRSR